MAKKIYYPRIADTLLKNKLESKGAVLVEGAKWCGKTTTAENIAKSSIHMDDTDLADQYLQLSNIQASLLLEGDTPRLIDEWQLVPKIWDSVRREVDKRDEFGQFILTGSSVPINFDEIKHSGTGRISRMKMRPMSLYESNDSTGEVSLKDLFSGKKDISGVNKHDLSSIAYLICRGGWPKAINQKENVALQQAIDYYDAIVNVDILKVDEVKRYSERAKRVLRSYARNISSDVSASSMLSDIKNNDVESFDNDTLYSYLSALTKLFVIEETTAWNPNLRSKTAIRSKNTRYFVDPSIATAALGLGPQDLINDLNTAGLLFENMCVRDLRIYAEVLDGNEYHYRDKNGLECDAVIHLRNGSYGLIEIKLGGEKLINEGVNSLLKLSNKIDTDKMKKPSFLMILTATSPYAYQREDGIYIVPIGCLKD